MCTQASEQKLNYLQVNIPRFGYVKVDEILKVFPISKSLFYKRVADGVYPRPVKLGPRASAWSADFVWSLLEGTHPSLSQTKVAAK